MPTPDFFIFGSSSSSSSLHTLACEKLCLNDLESAAEGGGGGGNNMASSSKTNLTPLAKLVVIYTVLLYDFK